MKTIRDVLRNAQLDGVPCTSRTFWNYHRLGLLPEGQKIPGRGNKVFFPDNTNARLWLIHILTNRVGFSIADLKRYPWAQHRQGTRILEIPKAIPKAIYGAKQEIQLSRDRALKKAIKILGSR